MRSIRLSLILYLVLLLFLALSTVMIVLYTRTLETLADKDQTTFNSLAGAASKPPAANATTTSMAAAWRTTRNTRKYIPRLQTCRLIYCEWDGTELSTPRLGSKTHSVENRFVGRRLENNPLLYGALALQREPRFCVRCG